MRIYVVHKGETCELLNYQNTKGQVNIKSPSDGQLRVNKSDIKIIGFRNGKGDSGDLRIIGYDPHAK